MTTPLGNYFGGLSWCILPPPGHMPGCSMSEMILDGTSSLACHHPEPPIHACVGMDMHTCRDGHAKMQAIWTWTRLCLHGGTRAWTYKPTWTWTCGHGRGLTISSTWFSLFRALYAYDMGGSVKCHILVPDPRSSGCCVWRPVTRYSTVNICQYT